MTLTFLFALLPAIFFSGAAIRADYASEYLHAHRALSPVFPILAVLTGVICRLV